jgi:colanic acid biosynthesis glycosyl transferase WcaI
VFFVNRFYRPDISATSQMLTQLAEHLSEQGFAVEVITGRAAYASGDVENSVNMLADVSILRVGGSRATRRNLLLRALESARMLGALAVAIFRRARAGDVVVALTDPPLLGVVAWCAARARGAHSVQWLQDVFPEVATAIFPANMRWITKAVTPLRDAALKRSDAVVVIGELMREYVLSRGVAAINVSLIANWADERKLHPLFAPVDERVRQGLYPSTRLLVGYQGNMGRAHDASAILAATIHLVERNDVRFLLTGGGVGFDFLRREVDRRQLANIEFRSYVPDEQLNRSLCLPDIHLISLRPEVEGFVVPSKIYSVFAAGRGVLFLGSPSGEIASIIRSSGAGMVISPTDGRALADALAELADAPRLAVEWGLNARSYLTSRASQAQSFRRWRELLAAMSVRSSSTARFGAPK